MTAPARTIIDLMDGPLAPFYEGPSWDRWRAVLRAAYALPMTCAYFTRWRVIVILPSIRCRSLWRSSAALVARTAWRA